jgi:hypothetical protein
MQIYTQVEFQKKKTHTNISVTASYLTQQKVFSLRGLRTVVSKKYRDMYGTFIVKSIKSVRTFETKSVMLSFSVYDFSKTLIFCKLNAENEI